MPDKVSGFPGSQEDTTGPSPQGKDGSSGSSGSRSFDYGNHKGGKNKGDLNALSRLNDGTHHTTGKGSS